MWFMVYGENVDSSCLYNNNYGLDMIFLFFVKLFILFLYRTSPLDAFHDPVLVLASELILSYV